MQKFSNIRELSRAYYKDISKTLIAEKKTVQTAEFKLDDFQKKVIKSKSKFLRVVAPAGAGKTQTLVAKATDILRSDQRAKVLCLTFTNAACREFEERAQENSASITNRLQVSTVNAFGYEILRALDKNLQIISPNAKWIGRVYGVIKAAMAESEVWDYESKGKLYSCIYELSDLTKSLGFNHESDEDKASDHFDFIESIGMDRLLKAGMKEVEICGDELREDFLEKWFPFWQQLTASLWDAGVISLDDQKYWALDQISEDTDAFDWLRDKKLTHIFVDEFQDINVLDLYLIQQILIVTGASLIIVGDDDQCLYEWRACTSAFIRYSDHFFEPVMDGEKFEEVILERNYRCPRNIVNHTKKLIARNEQRIAKKTIPMREDDANIRVIPLPAAYMTMNVVHELINHLAEKYPKHSVAIVGRKKCQLVPIQILLTKSKIRFKVDADLNVFTGNAFKDFRKILEFPKIYTERRPASQNIADFILLLNKTVKSSLSENDKNGVQQYLAQKEPKTLREALKHFGNYDEEFRRGYVNPWKIVPELQQLLESETIVKFLFTAGEVLKGFKKDFVKSKEDIFYSEPPFSHLADLAVNYKDNFADFLYDIDQAIERAELNDPRGAKIELMTALRTKGREFDTVIVLDANDGIFPNKKSEEEGHIEEERRLFYVTATRTKNNLLLFDSGRINGKQMMTSRFIREMELPATSWLVNPQLDRISRELFSELKI
ncbi:MAG TPA: ATP-dependent helicase [Pyrinomonadaceae bacterium]|nr:ATP-dependent helicase [Pyrinomonadaceae bacterium]